MFKKNTSIVCETEDNGIAFFKFNLYNSKGERIYTGVIQTHKLVKIMIPKADIYKFEIKAFNGYTPLVAYRWVRLSPYINNMQYFKFIPIKCIHRKVRANFSLTESCYTKFPISKGVLTLCPI